MTEIEFLNRAVSEVLARTEAVIRKRYSDPKRNLRLLSIADRKRLFNLLVWEQRYSLNLETMLTVLFDHYDTFGGVFKVRDTRRRMRCRGLPTPAKILMGKNSEAILQDYIKELYPNQEHVQLSKQLRQERLISQRLTREHLALMTKKITDYESLDSYVQDYNETANTIYNRASAVRDYLSKNTRSYRTNPWR